MAEKIVLVGFDDSHINVGGFGVVGVSFDDTHEGRGGDADLINFHDDKGGRAGFDDTHQDRGGFGETGLDDGAAGDIQRSDTVVIPGVIPPPAGSALSRQEQITNYIVAQIAPGDDQVHSRVLYFRPRNAADTEPIEMVESALNLVEAVLTIQWQTGVSARNALDATAEAM